MKQRTFTVMAIALFLLNSLEAESATPNIDGGAHHTIAVKTNGNIFTFGWNRYGQLGVGTTDDNYYTPTRVKSFINNVNYIAAGEESNVVVKNDGTVWAWGRNDPNMLGTNCMDTVCPVPLQVNGISNVIAITAGDYHYIALKNDGSVWSWGINYNGQLGINNGNITVTSPTKVDGLPKIKAISANRGFTLALDEDGTVWSWGRNDSLQLGRITTGQSSSTPGKVEIPAGNKIITIASGSEHGLALTDTGDLYSWGFNYYGELSVGGNNNQLYYPTKSVIDNIPGKIIKIASDGHFNLAMTDKGDIYGWGANDYGQLGINSFNSIIFKPTKTLASNIVGVGNGFNHSLAIAANGDVFGWGLGEYTGISQMFLAKTITPILIKNGDDAFKLKSINECVDYIKKNYIQYSSMTGNANTWWDQLDKITRQQTPTKGAVLVFPGPTSAGHVAYVSDITSSREIRVNQANWSRNTGDPYGLIWLNARIQDVSSDNSWTKVKVEFGNNGELGATTYDTYGFILPNTQSTSNTSSGATPSF